MVNFTTPNSSAKEKEAQIADLKADNVDLKARIEALERLGKLRRQHGVSPRGEGLKDGKLSGRSCEPEVV